MGKTIYSNIKKIGTNYYAYSNNVKALVGYETEPIIKYLYAFQQFFKKNECDFEGYVALNEEYFLEDYFTCKSDCYKFFNFCQQHFNAKVEDLSDKKTIYISREEFKKTLGNIKPDKDDWSYEYYSTLGFSGEICKIFFTGSISE